jgi:hypothetical protein
MRLRPRRRRSDAHEDGASKQGDDGESPRKGRPDEVMWEVGSVSDASDEEEKEDKRIGVGGTRDGRGERGGLLFADEHEEEGNEEDKRRWGGGEDGEEQSPFGDGRKEDDDFGDYESVQKEEAIMDAGGSRS